MSAGTALVVDSHAFIWDVQASRRLSHKARQAMDDATAANLPLLVSAVTLVELVYLMEKGRFTAADIDALFKVLTAADSGFEVSPVDGTVARSVGRVPRESVTDPFDRMIAATALGPALRWSPTTIGFANCPA